MPHKRNPITAERLSGLARLLRGNLSAGLEDVALWHERDISHCSVERVILPDSLACSPTTCCARRRDSSTACACSPTACWRTSTARYGLVFSQPVLLALVAAGLHPRRGLPRSCRTRPCGLGGGAARSARCSRPTPGAARRAEQLDEAFSLERALRNIGPRVRRPGGDRRDAATHSTRGKVRDIYDAGDDRLLMVTSDRMSAFDVVMAEPDARQGPGAHRHDRVLVRAAGRRRAQPPRLASTSPTSRRRAPTSTTLAGRVMLVRRAEMLPIECIVRGYLSGSAWKEYQATGTMHGTPLPAGLQETRPAARAGVHAVDQGRRRATTRTSASTRPSTSSAPTWPSAARDICLGRLPRGARRGPPSAGIIIADTKFELGLIDGELALCDEVLTPDSSRFWPADEWKPGTTPPSFDKQPRARLARGDRLGQDSRRRRRCPTRSSTPPRQRYVDGLRAHHRARRSPTGTAWAE